MSLGLETQENVSASISFDNVSHIEMKSIIFNSLFVGVNLCVMSEN